MDGNARWARSNNLVKDKGYHKGLQVLEKIIEQSLKKNIKILTVFALSSENIFRKDVNIIFNIIRKNFKNKNILEKFQYINFNLIGNKENIPKDILAFFKNLENKNNEKKRMIFNLAFNYGAWEEIQNCIYNILKNSKKKPLKYKEINEKLIKENLYTKNIPDQDLLIRTGGYKRLSNFLLLQLKYTELFFIKTFWPDFNVKIFNNIIKKYNKIDRKYGL